MIRTLRTAAAAVCLALLAGGCYPAKTTRQIERKYVATDTARLTGYMRDTGGGWFEEVPGGIQHSVILDEATLTKAGAPTAETCAKTIVRTSSADDEPLDQLGAKFIVDGVETEALVRGETVSVRDYGFSGQESVVVMEGVAMSEYLGLAVSRPAEKVFRVVERRAELCAQAGPGSTVSLKLTNRRMGRNTKYVREFVWVLK